MKIIIICLSILFASCSSGQNDVMARLLEKQKSLQDSINFYRNAESYYYGKAKEAMRDPDSSKWKSLADSSSNSSMLGMKRQKDLKQVEFSIDSLTKIK